MNFNLHHKTHLPYYPATLAHHHTHHSTSLHLNNTHLHQAHHLVCFINWPASSGVLILVL